MLFRSREYLYVDDAADALVFLMERYSDEALINVAGTEEISIAALAGRIAALVNYRGEIRYEPSKSDGMPRKVLDGSRLSAAGWKPSIPLDVGLERTYQWFLNQYHDRQAFGFTTSEP